MTIFAVTHNLILVDRTRHGHLPQSELQFKKSGIGYETLTAMEKIMQEEFRGQVAEGGMRSQVGLGESLGMTVGL